jgi:hypothetical protein
MAFKPFDAHFAETIERFESHSKLFRKLMTTTSVIAAQNFYQDWANQMSQVHTSLDQVKSQQRPQDKDDSKTLMSAYI